jgi:predicted branched-subunit amino acid permease
VEGRDDLPAELHQAPVGQLGLLDASARAATGLEHDHVRARVRQLARRRQAGEPGSEHHHVMPQQLLLPLCTAGSYTTPRAYHARDMSVGSEQQARESTFLDGVRAGIPFAIAGGLLAASFGVVAQEAGLSPVAAIVMSAIVFAGSAQFAAVAIIADGGTVGAAVAAAALMNSRFLPMGVALGPSLPGGALSRAAQGQAVVDASWALASRGDGSFDRMLLLGSAAIQYATWTMGTVVGAIWGEKLGDPERLGLDAIYPAFFLALLLIEMKSRRALGVAVLGALIALALIPVAPAGVPVLVASLASLVGLHRRMR